MRSSVATLPAQVCVAVTTALLLLLLLEENKDPVAVDARSIRCNCSVEEGIRVDEDVDNEEISCVSASLIGPRRHTAAASSESAYGSPYTPGAPTPASDGFTGTKLREERGKW
jgi:hypothetical protein